MSLVQPLSQSFASLNSEKTTTTRSAENADRAFLRIAKMIVIALSLLVLGAVCISEPVIIPIVLVFGIGFNEYYKMQR